MYYYHRNALKNQRGDGELKSQIETIYHSHEGRYGYRRIIYVLKAMGVVINHERAQRLMTEQGLKSKVGPKRYKSYKGDVGRVAENVLNCDFNAQNPNQKWVTDVTEFKVHSQKVYLSPVIDLFN